MFIKYPEYLNSYVPVGLFFGIALILASVIIILPNFLSNKKPGKSKLDAYECGFEAFGDARGKFDVRFYLISILFIVFDIEIAFLFPWVVSLGKIGIFGFVSMMIFLFVLMLGFIYEWKKGALEWD